MSSSSSPPRHRRIGCGALLALAVAAPAGCGGEGNLTGGSAETISTGEGQAVIPKQELINLKKSLEEGRSPGVRYTLADVGCELQRRKPYRFDPREIAKTIIDQSRAAPDGITTPGKFPG